MKKMVTAGLAIACAAALFTACSGSKGSKAGGASDKAVGYTFGEGKTFHSDEKETYSISFSDASWYAMQDTWKTEGVFKDIEDTTNVHLDITSYDSGDYGQKVNLAINSGSATYIIPKIYSEDQYVAGGGVVPVSDYTQYMPNFTAFVNKYNMNPDLDTIRQSDGKFYRLPGMHQAALQDYTIMVREDIFEAAGYNIRELENIVEHAIVLSENGVIRLEDLPENVQEEAREKTLAIPHQKTEQEVTALPLQSSTVSAKSETTRGITDDEDASGEILSLEEMERRHILHALSVCKNNKTEVCKKLGISRATLWRKLKELQIAVED